MQSKGILYYFGEGSGAYSFLALPTGSGGVVTFPQVPLSRRSVVELTAIGSPFFVGGPTIWADAWRYLWRHHPGYITRTGSMPNRAERKASAMDRLRAFFIRLRIAIQCGRLNRESAARIIRFTIEQAGHSTHMEKN